jgi:hypothetical protein
VKESCPILLPASSATLQLISAVPTGVTCSYSSGYETDLIFSFGAETRGPAFNQVYIRVVVPLSNAGTSVGEDSLVAQAEVRSRDGSMNVGALGVGQVGPARLAELW